MRLWTIHPKYLDRVGLVAVWREGLLALRVLEDKTKGYRHHPQLIRFKESQRPCNMMAAYLLGVHMEACRRGYSFDQEKISVPPSRGRLVETRGQLIAEWRHFLNKLKGRTPDQYRALKDITEPDSHPIFRITHGDVRKWEKARQA